MRAEESGGKAKNLLKMLGSYNVLYAYRLK